MPSWLKEGRGSLCGANVSLLLREMGITKPLLVAGERTKNVFFARTGMRLPVFDAFHPCLLYTSPSPRDKRQSRMPSSA